MTPAKILCVAGARPNFMKVGPVLRALRARPSLTARLVHTGQHYDVALSQVFFEDLQIPRPEVELEVGSGSHALQTAEIMKRFEPVLDKEQPSIVVVVGDVNSTLACALVAAKFRLATPFPSRHGPRVRPLVAHVEAGLRSFDDDMPEEINRRATDAVSDLLFVSEPSGLDNLKREGVPGERMFFVGNVMIDSLLGVRGRAEKSLILEQLGLASREYGVVTLHRPSNVDDPAPLGALLGVLDEFAARLPLVFVVHPRTRARLGASGQRLVPPRWHTIDPLGYVDFVRLLSESRIVFTDSGGIQEETTVLGVPCVTLRENTERPATVSEGTNILGGTRPETIRLATEAALLGPPRRGRPQLWDGSAAERIANELQRALAP